MEQVTARGFLSPTLVLLAMDWAHGADRDEFLGFAINRTIGFRPNHGAKPNPSDDRLELGKKRPFEKNDGI